MYSIAYASGILKCSRIPVSIPDQDMPNTSSSSFLKASSTNSIDPPCMLRDPEKASASYRLDVTWYVSAAGPLDWRLTWATT